MPDPVPFNITSSSLCQLCKQFITELIALDFIPPSLEALDNPPAPGQWIDFRTDEETAWSNFGGSSWGPAFHHHDSLASLQESSKTCEMCNVLFADLSELAPVTTTSANAINGSSQPVSDNGELPLVCQGWLGLYPFWSHGRMDANRRRGPFRAGFRKGLKNMPIGSDMISAMPLHTFRICRIVDGSPEKPRLPWWPQEGDDDLLKKDATMAVPESLEAGYITRAVDSWQKECLGEHDVCKAKFACERKCSLPTRVLDLEFRQEGTAVEKVGLYLSRKGQSDDYVALSHCWGGSIPSITVQANLWERLEVGIATSDLPQNFQDAIHVTKALGIRYLWIDALCIIQDSEEDWKCEAGRMASLYSGAKVVVSALDASSSTEGFLHPRPVPQAVLNDDYAIQKCFQQVYAYLKDCPLTTRAWCMQERLLAPAILHIGRERMFWECLKYFNHEEGGFVDGYSTGDVMGKFIALRNRLGGLSMPAWKDWYGVLEEYTTRNLTVSTDKLPALAGAAALFQQPEGDSESPMYLAGLWRDDLARGLLWGAHYYHIPTRKVWGYSSSDVCTRLSVPPVTDRAPSWSWASLDGQIDHWALRIGPGSDWYEVLEVEMDEGLHELTAKQCSGSVRIRGPIEQVKYIPHPEGGDVGSLAFLEESVLEAESNEDMKMSFGGCVLDMARQEAHECWALIATRSNDDRYMLLLEERGDGTFKRVGFCTAYRFTYGSHRFSTREVVIR